MLKFLHSRPLPKDIAKSRLKFIIVSDRNGVTPHVLNIIKNEILTIMIKYVDINMSGVSLDLVKNSEIELSEDVEDRGSSLVIKVPFNNNVK